MIIALPSKENNEVDDHFGHCAFFTVVNVESDKIVGTKIVSAPEGCGCKSGIAVTLKDMGVTILLAGNMGAGAKSVLEAQGIEVVRGCHGSVESVVYDYITGKIKDSGQLCEEDHEGCHHASLTSDNGVGHAMPDFKSVKFQK